MAGRVVILAALVALTAGRGSPALASGVGVDLIHNETRRSASADVPGSVASSVVRDRQLGFWHMDGPDEHLDVDGEHETYTLRSAGDRGLIDLSLLKGHGRYRLARERWALDLGALAINVQRNAAVYAPVPQDDRNTFLLPAFVLDLTPRPALLRAGYWEEYEVLPLDANTYAVTVARVFVLGAGYRFSTSAVARLEARQTRRTYPQAFALSRTDLLGEFRLADPLGAGEGGLWREASVEVQDKHYPVSGDRFAEAILGSVLRFRGAAVTHFVTPQLAWANSFVVYRPGALPETLLEDTQRRSDLSAHLAYEAFRRLGEGPYLLAWGGSLQASLLRRVQRMLVVHVKLERTY